MMHILRTELTLPVPLPEVFDFFSRAENLELITPPQLRFKITTPLPIAMQQGTRIDYSLRLHGIRFGWRSAITEWNPPYAFVDEQLSGPYRQWIHRHTFEETGGGTAIRDEVHYRLPLSPLGEIALPIVRRQLQGIFAYREAAVRKHFGQ